MSNDGADKTKAETYEAMGVINRSFEQITTALYGLKSKALFPKITLTAKKSQ